MERRKSKLFGINKIFFLLIFVLFIGIALRAQELISHNFLFLLDQGRDMVAVKGILYDHHLTLIGPSTSLRGVFQGPLWYYLLALSSAIFGGDPWGGIVLMFTISISVLLVIFFWMRKLFGEKVALITAFLFAVCPEAAAAATYTWNPHPMWLLIVIYVFSFYSAIYKSKKFNIIMWPIIGLMFHFQTALAVFILLTTIIYILIFQRKIILNKNFFIGIILFACTFMPQVVFDLRHNFLMSKSALNLFVGKEQGLFVSGENKGYLDLVKNHIFSFYDNYMSSFIREGIAKYIPYLFIVCILWAISQVKKQSRIFSQHESNFILFISKLLLIVFLLSFIYPFPIRYWFLTGFQAFYLIILGLILSKFLVERLGKAFAVSFFVVLIFYSWLRIDALYFNPTDDGGAEKIKGKLSAIDYIYKDAKEKNFGLLVFTPAVYTDNYDYLIWWYGGRKYNYIPHKEKEGIFYLLIESDRSKPWSYNGWLETVIKTGNIIESKTLPTGLIIQKRSM